MTLSVCVSRSNFSHPLGWKNGLASLRLTILTFLLLISAFSIPAHAAPVVISFDLVSSTRTGRTTFDYTYKLRVRGDRSSYTNASYRVASTAPATQIVDSTVTLGAVDAGVFFRSTDTFTIRQDRTTPFDPESLRFLFFGTKAGGSGSSTGPNIGPISFQEEGGRPGHEGLFPIQGTAPPGDTNLPMIVTIFGEVSFASYRFLSATNQVLSEGALPRVPPESAQIPDFAAMVTTPHDPFVIEITAMGLNGSQPIVWRSHTYSPAPLLLKIVPSSGLVTAGQAIDVTLRVTSISASGDYKISLLLPKELSGFTGPWVVDLQPGAMTDIATTRLTASPTAFGGGFTIFVEAAPKAAPQNITTATLQVDIE